MSPREGPRSLHWDSIWVPATDDMYTKAQISIMPPMWAMTKNSHLAFSLSPFFERRKVTRVTISQDSRRTSAVSAAMQEKHARNRVLSRALYLQPESDVDFTTWTTMSMNITEEKEIIVAES